MNFWELLVVVLVALLVLGPDRLAELSIKLGRMTRRARLMYAQVKAEMEGELRTVQNRSETSRTKAEPSSGTRSLEANQADQKQI